LLHSCVMAEERRLLARKQVELSRKRYELQEIKHSLGQATMLDVMKAQNELAQVETALVEAAVNLLQTERRLEQFLDLSPGELGTFLQHLQGVQS
ncbi:MAG TPA: TolC family protein, partial [Treponema sp.]|nr:TolC family protein [Treponema sp.]